MRSLTIFLLASIGLAISIAAIPAPLNLFVAVQGNGGAKFSNDHSFLLDGSTTYLNIGDVAPFHALEYSTPNCLSYWAKTVSAGSSAILDKQPGFGYIWQWSNNSAGNPLFQLYDGSHNYQKATVSSFNDGSWHNVVQSWDGTCTGVMFVDGASASLQSFGSACPNTSVINTAPATIGAYHTHALLFYSGKLAQIAFWSGSTCNLSMATQIYNSGTPSDLTSLSPTVWYQFSTVLSPPDSPTGTVTDRGSAGANGTVGGTGVFSTDVP
jgi:hypothetical protein